MNRILHPIFSLFFVRLCTVTLLFLTLWNSTSAQKQETNDSFHLNSKLSDLWIWKELEPLAFIDIHSVAEDPQERLWFAATGELLLYDGYKVHKNPFPEQFKHSKTIDLHISQTGLIYIYTTDGLLQYQAKEDKWRILERFQFKDHWFNNVIIESDTGTVFTMTPSGLYKINQSDLTLLYPGKKGRIHLAISRDYLWLSAETQILQFHLTNGEISEEQPPITHTPPNLKEGFKPNFRIIANDSNDVFIFTYSKELDPLTFDSSKNQFVPTKLFQKFGSINFLIGLHIGKYENDLLVLGHSQNLHRVNGEWQRLNIKSKRPMNDPYLFKRSNGNLIIGGSRERVYEIDTSQSNWERFDGLNFHCESKSGKYWFISFEGEILEYDPEQSIWMHHIKNVINAPLSIMESSNGHIWVSGSHDGTAAVSHFDGVKWVTDLHPQLSTRIGHSSALELSNHDIIFGAGNETYKAAGIVIYHKNGNSYEKKYYFSPMVPDRIELITEGRDGIYFGGKQLYRWNIGSQYEVLEIPGGDFRWIDTLESDAAGNIWVGTLPNNGVHQWNGEKWTTFSGEPFSQTGEVVYVAYEPSQHDLWITCRNDMVQYQTSTQSWISKSFDKNLLFHRESGNLRFDRSSNLWINQSPRSWVFRVNPDTSTIEDLKTKFKTNRYTPDKSRPKVWMESFPEKLTEPASALIRWDGIDFYSKTSEDDLAYSFKINDDEWSAFTTSKELVVDKLKSGDYNISIRCRDLDGNISESPATATFTVLPLLWKQPWFIATAVTGILTIIGLIILTVYLRVHHIIEIEKFKNRFFMNMSHELRTPLTVILGPLESLKQSKLSPKDTEKLELAHKNSQKMLSLIDQLLDFRRLNNGLNERKYEHADIIAFLKEEIDCIKPMFEMKHQTLEVVCSVPVCEAWFESEKVEHIVENLLSNACKYTRPNGNILVEISTKPFVNDSELLTFSVIDNGEGVPKSLQKKVFDPFFRIQRSNETQQSGTGLGLAFVKELTDSMNAKISIESPVGNTKSGTKVTVLVPLPKTVKSEFQKESNSDEIKVVTDPAIAKPIEKKNDLPGTTLLLVEDDSDIRKFLTLELESDFEIIEASDGEEGIKKAKEHIPDIIISDVLMPKMNGFSFCENLKETNETSHIPVLMLTALKADQHELKALQKGADDFINKPVSIGILKQKIKNLLQLRQKMHRKFEIQKAQGKFDGAEITTIRSDEVFITRIIEIIKESYQDPHFDVESIASKMFMSRVTLYRKFKAITGESPSQFIKTLRMNKAEVLLKSSDYTVAEISDRVGYKEPGYFGTAFKSQFGDTPKQYRDKNR